MKQKLFAFIATLALLFSLLPLSAGALSYQTVKDSQIGMVKGDTTVASPRDGQIISLNGTVYLVDLAGLYGFPSLTVFKSWGYLPEKILPALPTESALSMLDLVPMRDSGCSNPLAQIHGTCGGSSPRIGQLVKTQDRTIYVVVQGGLLGIPSLEVFKSWGFASNQIAFANSAESSLSQIGLVPSRDPACKTPMDQLSSLCGTAASASPRTGQLITKGKTIYLVSPTPSLLAFSSKEIFYSWGFTFKQIIQANKAELALAQTNLVPMKDPNCQTAWDQLAGSCIVRQQTLDISTNMGPAIVGQKYIANFTIVNGGLQNSSSLTGTGAPAGLSFSNSVRRMYACDPLPDGTGCGGLLSDPTYAILSGTPTQAGSFVLELVAVSNGQTVSKHFTLVVNPTSSTAPVISSLSLTSGAVGATLIITGSGLNVFQNAGNGDSVGYNIWFTNGNYSIPMNGTISSDNLINAKIPETLCPGNERFSCTSLDTIKVSPGDYSIYVKGVNGSSLVTNKLTYTVTSPQTSTSCVINSFAATSSTINVGQSTQLAFSLTNCTDSNIKILDDTNTYLGFNSPSPVTISPTATKTYVLSASNAIGAATSQKVTVTVTGVLAYSCLPSGVSSDTLVSSDIGAYNTVTVSQKLSSLRAVCQGDKLVDGSGKPIYFYNLIGCWGNPPNNYLELMANQSQEIAKLQFQYNVITIPCSTSRFQIQ